MSASPTAASDHSSGALNFVANAAFIPIGMVTVLLSPLLPELSSRWSLNYAQEGSLFTVQLLASTVCVALSGLCSSRWGFGPAIKIGLLAMAAGVVLLPYGSPTLGVIGIGLYGAGSGLAVPAVNLMVAAANYGRHSAAVNLLNFFWSAGAVACPLMVASAVSRHRVPQLLFFMAAILLLAFSGFAMIRSHVTQPPVLRVGLLERLLRVNWRKGPVLRLAGLFFLYIGLELSIGGWSASYARTLLPSSSHSAISTPSFFYLTLTVGRWLASFLLKTLEAVTLARRGLLLVCVGTTCLLLSHTALGLILSLCVAGFGLAAVYPITISLLSRLFGEEAAALGSVMFTLANLGGALLPWLVGFIANGSGNLRAGMAVPLIAGMCMFALCMGTWSSSEKFVDVQSPTDSRR